MPRTFEQRAVAALLFVLGAVIVYRAATQSVVYDEAFTYLAFLSGDPSLVFTAFTANNHVLFSAAARLSTGLLGPSAFALRLPTVLAGLAYLWLASAVCRRALGSGRLSAIAIAALTLNPFILDFLVAGRGYGMALAFLMVALHQLLGVDADDRVADRRRWVAASVALGLSVCANLTFAFPAGALALVAAGREVASVRGESALRALGSRVASMAPGVLIAVALLVRPLLAAKAEHFTYGTDALGQTMLSLVAASIRHNRSPWPADPEFIQADVRTVFVAMAILTPIVLWIVGRLIRTSGPTRSAPSTPADHLATLAGGSALLSLLALAAAHATVGVRYPFGRTGIYLIVLCTLMLAAVAAQTPSPPRRGRRWLSHATVALMAMLVVRFAIEFDSRYFYHWRFDAGTKELFQTIVDRSRGRGEVEVATAELFEPSLEFYRVTRRANRLRVDAEGWIERPTAYHYLVVSPASGRELARGHRSVLRTASVHAVSGAVLMENVVPLINVPIVR